MEVEECKQAVEEGKEDIGLEEKDRDSNRNPLANQLQAGRGVSG